MEFCAALGQPLPPEAAARLAELFPFELLPVQAARVRPIAAAAAKDVLSLPSVLTRNLPLSGCNYWSNRAATCRHVD